jgi:integrase
VNADRQTVAAFLTRWLEGVKIDRTPNTHSCYERAVRLHVNPHIGGIRLQQLEPMHVQGLYATLAKKGASPRLRQLVHAVLHKALKTAVKWRMVRSNAADAVDRPNVARKEMHVPTPEQMHALLDAARTHRLYPLIALALTTGMRQGELFGLEWNDFDLDAGTVFVQRTLEELQGKFRLKAPKSAAGRRRIELPAVAVAALREHRKAMLAEGHIAGPVFCDGDGGYLRKSNFIRRVYAPLLKAAGLPHFRFHDLRHGHATMMLALGENPKVVQERLGHAQISLTLDTYSHVLPTLGREAADRIDAAFRKVAEV